MSKFGTSYSGYIVGHIDDGYIMDLISCETVEDIPAAIEAVAIAGAEKGTSNDKLQAYIEKTKADFEKLSLTEHNANEFTSIGEGWGGMVILHPMKLKKFKD